MAVHNDDVERKFFFIFFFYIFSFLLENFEHRKKIYIISYFFDF